MGYPNCWTFVLCVWGGGGCRRSARRGWWLTRSSRPYFSRSSCPMSLFIMMARRCPRDQLQTGPLPTAPSSPTTSVYIPPPSQRSPVSATQRLSKKKKNSKKNSKKLTPSPYSMEAGGYENPSCLRILLRWSGLNSWPVSVGLWLFKGGLGFVDPHPSALYHWAIWPGGGLGFGGAGDGRGGMVGYIVRAGWRWLGLVYTRQERGRRSRLYLGSLVLGGSITLVVSSAYVSRYLVYKKATRVRNRVLWSSSNVLLRVISVPSQRQRKRQADTRTGGQTDISSKGGQAHVEER
ncbi:hypothetical protein QBC39DRAFT_184541 [Podospora conica]|nr:hypothetical protein QBC39DRAFT_184541 [Schizothecium conicum]